MKKATKSAAPSEARPKVEKPDKPYEGFPLFPHDSGRWAKKIRGKLHYFGKWAGDWEGKTALAKFNAEWPYLSEGRKPPRDDGDFLTVGALCNRFLDAKKRAMNGGELAPRTYRNYYGTCKLVVECLKPTRRVDDLQPEDFAKLRAALGAGQAVATLRNRLIHARMMFRWAHRQRLISREVHYGESFAKPSAKLMRKARNERGTLLFSAAEVRKVLDALAGLPVEVDGEALTLKPDPVLRGMVMLAANSGFGNADLSALPLSAIDWEAGVVNFPRIKTEVPRRVPLWPETVEALREAIAARRKPRRKADADCVFLTSGGLRWARTQPRKRGDDGTGLASTDDLAQKFGRLLHKLHINGRKGLGIYTLRRNFETIGGESKDQVAVNSLMGHVDDSMAAVYRQGISDDRLRAVTETVRLWLFPTGAAAK